jgi:hypothetical protein
MNITELSNSHFFCCKICKARLYLNEIDLRNGHASIIENSILHEMQESQEIGFPGQENILTIPPPPPPPLEPIYMFGRCSGAPWVKKPDLTRSVSMLNIKPTGNHNKKEEQSKIILSTRMPSPKFTNSCTNHNQISGGGSAADFPLRKKITLNREQTFMNVSLSARTSRSNTHFNNVNNYKNNNNLYSDQLSVRSARSPLDNLKRRAPSTPSDRGDSKNADKIEKLNQSIKNEEKPSSPNSAKNDSSNFHICEENEAALSN